MDLLLSDVDHIGLGSFTLTIFHRALYFNVCDLRISSDQKFTNDIQQVLDEMKQENSNKPPIYWIKLLKRCQNIRSNIFQKIESFNYNLPDCFICVLCSNLLTDAVITKSGKSFCQLCIETYIKVNGTHPITQEPLTIQELIPNIGLRESVTYIREKMIA